MGEKGKTIGGRTLLEWKWFIPHRDNPKEMRRIDDLLDAAFAEPEPDEPEVAFETITGLRNRVRVLESKVKKLNGRVFSGHTPQEGE